LPNPNQKCNNSGICVNNITGKLYFADMNSVPISTAQVKDTVLLIADITQVKDKEVNYTIYKQGELSWNPLDWFTRKVAQFDNKGYTKWTTTSEGRFYFTVIIETGETFSSETETNGILTVTNTEDDSMPYAGIVKPILDSTYIINSSGRTNLISYEQNSSDIDDDLNITWYFGDDTFAGFSNCLTGTNCNTTHNYNTSGTKTFIVNAKEMTRSQYANARSRIFVYKEGLNIFAIIDEPPINQMINDPGTISINGSSSHVANCSYDSDSCTSKGNSYNPSRNCYSVTDRIDPNLRLWCYKFAESSDQKFHFLWTVDGDSANTPTDNSKFSKLLVGTKNHSIDLRVNYTF
jgi:hypothetical protein